MNSNALALACEDLRSKNRRIAPARFVQEQTGASALRLILWSQFCRSTRARPLMDFE